MTDRLRSIAYHDQQAAAIWHQWSQTEGDMKEELLAWLEDEDSFRAARFVADCPPQWVSFIQRIALHGLRSAVLESLTDRD